MVIATSSPTPRRLGGKGGRLVTLVFATIVGLSAGTNYLFSAYAPQLASRLALSSTQLNVIGSAGNLGVYLSGIPIGRLVDRHGPTFLLIFSAVALSSAFLIVHSIYFGGQDGIFSTIGVPGLALMEMLTGIGTYSQTRFHSALRATSNMCLANVTGSTAALAAAGNAIALSFKKTRATALSLVLSGFGLSAFFYSSIWREISPTTSDPTAALLLLLALGCGASMALGAITIRRPAIIIPASLAPVPPPSIVVNSPSPDDSEDDADTIAAGLFPSERTPLVRSNSSKSVHDEVISVSGWGLARELDFWLLFVFNGLCSGCGLMYINNVGTLQANLVSLLSVFNCLGRLLTGFLSDFMLHRAPAKWRFSRIWWNVSTAVMLVVAQITISRASTIDGVWTGLTVPTVLVGFAHGSVFGISGIIGLERFGIKHFSGNNGVLALAPAIFGQATNLMFGKIYDHQASRSSKHPSLLAASTCTLGRDCYLLSFRITTMMAVLALGFGLVLSNRQSMKRRAA
ncbi:BZ3500_MvSof-1268-A1-R1_Chr9g10645 [Microbotryum saponariae]|uniref:BZ3500_MvSof-1268-A1-R1_Chr9g10645 protein n=1 Tax=Microbotryum saponariae TaxID=289078 RepID=A0A2X0M6M8_9BASI|nr:BZ3501_MvSof-1269-A2-R1_Chr9g10393 [Microbotryum saponariae]SDA00445.1 BZ3500_MvSof-1268-A1-R1_Chr9g10645 [Microbotryum saponariae]